MGGRPVCVPCSRNVGSRLPPVHGGAGPVGPVLPRGAHLCAGSPHPVAVGGSGGVSQVVAVSLTTVITSSVQLLVQCGPWRPVCKGEGAGVWRARPDVPGSPGRWLPPGEKTSLCL